MKFLFMLHLLLLSYFLAAQQKPNIIYIMADDLGYADLSCYGRKEYSTPHLDHLAEQGVKLMNAYAGAPLCTPTRTSFMTGRYPARTPVGLMEPLRWGHKDSIVGLTPDYTSLPTLLRKAGYETYLVGKWHLGYDPKYSPNKNGFDYFFGFNAGGIDYVSHKNPKGIPDLYENETPVIRNGYLTDIWADKVVSLIRQTHQRPFFLSVQFNAPHWPWQGPNDPAYPDTLNWHKGGTPSRFAAMVKSLDEAVGRIIAAVDSNGLSKNTLIIFTSDNGGEEFSDMGIYRGKKETVCDGGIREPAIVRWAGQLHAGSVSLQPAITMDWTATILAAAHAKADPAFPLDGINLLPYLSNIKKIKPRTFYWRLSQEFHQKAIRHGKWKWIMTEEGEFLFDLNADPGEKNNLLTIYPKKVQLLKNKYAGWERLMLKPVEL
ncbi:MAG: sulfatase-like hydrolase/transferase [Bacteroidetes bacterium]|nr:sulfatase-like hydrolase/transferase [Bacteroidota bacterium]